VGVAAVRRFVSGLDELVTGRALVVSCGADGYAEDAEGCGVRDDLRRLVFWRPGTDGPMRDMMRGARRYCFAHCADGGN